MEIFEQMHQSKTFSITSIYIDVQNREFTGFKEYALSNIWIFDVMVIKFIVCSLNVYRLHVFSFIRNRLLPLLTLQKLSKLQKAFVLK